ncbi:DNA primase [Bellilinea caldifistulae]|uniref:DNA primase n=1 Tax=Bellilinea caldifistulae TaxID=360411 RepID=UPI000784CC8D|nr:DNA primase [Bellilinea caldifistulae]GAP09733.1 DNA primase [Bellilinea caldifistulae]
MSAIDEIKARIDIVELVSETVKLRRTGKNYIGFCPFHTNTRTPAFVVFPDSGTWRCFGQCNEGGDIFRFVMKKEGWDFSETLRYLAERAGVTLETPSPQQQAQAEEYDRLCSLLEEAVVYYRHQLLNTPAGNQAMAYLQQRGIQPQTTEIFELGYAPDSWDAALNYLRGKGYTFEEIREAGLLTERQDGSGYDRFRHRIMFPIRDMSGKITGFGGRVLRAEDQPKFLNSPQTPLFDKGRLLYGLHLARKSIRAQDQAVIVEGYLDVIALHQAGFTNAVSPMGTALSEDQLRLLKRFTRRIVLALDADAAGEKATLRGLEVARQAFDHQDEVVFDARGLLRHEARLQADLRVTTLPAGKDPDDVVLHDPHQWEQIVANARPVVIHVMESLAASREMDDPKAKSEIARQVLTLINDVPDAIERDAYRQRLARLLKIDERALQTISPSSGSVTRKAPARPRQPRPERPAPLQETQPERRAHEMEKHCLRLLVRNPEALYTLDRHLQANGLSRFSALDFELGEHQSLAALVLQSLAQDQMEPTTFLNQICPPELKSLLEDLQQPLPFGEPKANQTTEDLLRTFLMLRLIRINENLLQMRFLQQDLQEQSTSAISPYLELIPDYLQARNRLEKALAKVGEVE